MSMTHVQLYRSGADPELTMSTFTMAALPAAYKEPPPHLPLYSPHSGQSIFVIHQLLVTAPPPAKTLWPIIVLFSFLCATLKHGYKMWLSILSLVLSFTFLTLFLKACWIKKKKNSILFFVFIMLPPMVGPLHIVCPFPEMLFVFLTVLSIPTYLQIILFFFQDLLDQGQILLWEDLIAPYISLSFVAFYYICSFYLYLII